ncbi:hypothetical protein B5M43_004365 [Microbacterium sp. MEC084]|uniref:hypothetical protein n=1 Tax=Microbacterium sp. MEC084 TaxID=1963027 RepID=UPI00106FEBB1|nr:hypothetical protein [Microbacterium sp. MEC084]MCD1268083.1 hypothetical protein [Microbacterium sp. MEC084]
MRDLYPPVGTLLATVVARILPLGALGLSLLGALAAGFFLQKIAEAMVQRGLALPTRVLFLLAIAFNPFGVQLITRDSLLFLSIGFFALGVGETVRFLYWASTRDGFRAGILLMMAALTDPLGVALVAIAGIAAMFYLPDDLERPGRRRASVLVATFPTIGAFATFAFLQWAFGGLTAADVAAVLDGAGDRMREVVADLTGPQGLLLMIGLGFAWVLAITHGRARSIVFSVVAIVVHYVAIVLGWARTRRTAASGSCCSRSW